MMAHSSTDAIEMPYRHPDQRLGTRRRAKLSGSIRSTVYLLSARRIAQLHPHVVPCHTAAIFTDWNAVFHQRPAHPGIAGDRCARKIGAFLKACSGALAATECQAVGRAHG